MKNIISTSISILVIIIISSCSSDDDSNNNDRSAEVLGKWKVETAIQNNGEQDFDLDGVDNSDWVLEEPCIGDTTIEFTADGRMITLDPTQTLSVFGTVLSIQCLTGDTFNQDFDFFGNQLTVFAIDEQGNRLTNGTTFENARIENDRLIIDDFYNHGAQGIMEVVDFTFVRVP